MLSAGVCTALLGLTPIAAPALAAPVREQFSPAPTFGSDRCRDLVCIGQRGSSPDENEIGTGAAEERAADQPNGAALFEILQPDSAAPAGPELDTDAMILPGHQADFEAITFNWALYLEPLGSDGSRSTVGPELPLAAYAIGYTRPKKGVLAETRDYSFAPERILGRLGLILCVGALVTGVLVFFVLPRRRGG